MSELHLHSVRHFVATQLVARGDVSARTVAGRLGHRDASVTMKVYASYFPAADVEAAEHLGRALATRSRPGVDRWRTRLPRSAAPAGAQRCASSSIPPPGQSSATSPITSAGQRPAQLARRAEEPKSARPRQRPGGLIR